jgi:hypothetical protein
MDEKKWNLVATPALITAKQMILICLALEIVIGFVFILIAERFEIPQTDLLWWVLQMFGLVVSTNLGAVILAIIAQKNVNDLGKIYREVFTIDFYKTLHEVTAFRQYMIEEAHAEGRTFDEELKDLAGKMYRIGRAQIDVKANGIEPMQPLNETVGEDELFGE